MPIHDLLPYIQAPRPIVGGSIGSRTVRETGVDTEDISPNTALDKLEQHDKSQHFCVEKLSVMCEATTFLY